MAIGRQRTMIRTATVLLGAVALVAASASAVLAADHAVSISGFSFSPRDLTVAAGDTVTWTNSDAQAHTASATDGSWDTGNLGNGASGTVTFATAGSFPYRCDIHPDMTGSITVQAAGAGGGATTPPTDTLAPTTPATPVTGDGAAGALVVLLAFGLGGAAVIRRLARQS